MAQRAGASLFVIHCVSFIPLCVGIFKIKNLNMDDIISLLFSWHICVLSIFADKIDKWANEPTHKRIKGPARGCYEAEFGPWAAC